MSITASIILGIIQGITEPLPVSSSAHLLLANKLFGLGDGGLAFDAALHVGTGLALLCFFYRKWFEIGKQVLKNTRALLPLRQVGNRAIPNSRKSLNILVGILPAIIAGLLFEDLIEEYLRTPLVVVVTLITVGVLMWLAANKNWQVLPPKILGIKSALIVGLAQVLALIPGVSRSGITISTTLLLGLSATQAFEFSFLMGAPLTLGAGSYQVLKLYMSNVAVDWLSFTVGIMTSFVVGLFALWVFKKLFSKYSLKPFVFYRFVLSLLVLLFYS